MSRTLSGAVLTCLIFLTVAATAWAWVYTDIVDFNLTETAYTYGVYSMSSSGDGSASYRWVDDPSHTTVISGNNCPDLALLGGPATIPAHDVAYHGLFGGASAGACSALRGRVATGAGSVYNATCQWYRALKGGREPVRAAQMVQEAPGWPALRDTEPAAVLAAAAREVLAGGFGPAAGALLEQCLAAHAREVAWAEQMGLPPST